MLPVPLSVATLDCVPDAVIYKVRTAVDRAEEKQRVCLNCARTFRSRGPWNRICQRCLTQRDQNDRLGKLLENPAAKTTPELRATVRNRGLYR